jgi:homeobox-leucine zipper protein
MGNPVILPLAHTLEHEEVTSSFQFSHHNELPFIVHQANLLFSHLQFLEVLRLEGHGFTHDELLLARDMYLLQVWCFSGLWLQDVICLLYTDGVTLFATAALQWG